MKNRIFLSLALVFFINQSVISQFSVRMLAIDTVEYIVDYSMKYQQDSANPNFILEEEMVLLIGKSVSKFLSNNLMIGDTMLKNINSPEGFQKMLNDPVNPLPRVRFQHEVFKNMPHGEITNTDHIIGGSFKFLESMNQFNWQLLSETSTIDGIRIQKAICNFGGRDWIAWFAPEVPIKDGPYKFNGLPGLIMRIYDTKNHYNFDFIRIRKPTARLMIEIKDKDYIQTTKQKFFKAREDFRNDIISRAKEAGISAEGQQAAAKNMSMKNNPIELMNY
ncbi:MAG: hypothetical protein FD155_1759 [Bacteroidetes bacterium]|nr:MAG: hypothetical protein FD155_1759 [Bacteroidota bacterium]